MDLMSKADWLDLAQFVGLMFAGVFAGVVVGLMLSDYFFAWVGV